MNIKTETLLLIKAIGYRFFGTLCTFIISYVFTGSLIISTSIGLCEVFSKIFLYYAYDKLWNFGYNKIKKGTNGQNM